MSDRLIVSASPHYRSHRTTRSIMFNVILALFPILIMSVVMYGWRSFALCLVSVGSCMIFESFFNVIRKKSNSVQDLSAAVTGMLISFILPVTVSYLTVIAGAFFGIVVVKMLFGGIGKNFLNPALAAKAFITVSASPVYVVPFSSKKLPVFVLGGFSSESVAAVSGTPVLGAEDPNCSILDMFIGNTAGNMGETCMLLIIICGCYLIFKGVITWHIPVAYIGSAAALTYIFPFGKGLFNADFMITQLFSGGLLLAAFFMATDYSTCPVTNKGRLIHGFGCGVLTVIFRYFGSGADGVIYAILIMNVFAQSLDVITRPSRYGKGGIRREEKLKAE